MRTHLITVYAIAFVSGIVASYYFPFDNLYVIIVLLILSGIFSICFIRKQESWNKAILISIISLLGFLNLSVNRSAIEKGNIVEAKSYTYAVQNDPIKTSYGYKCHALVQQNLVELNVSTKNPIKYGDVLTSKSAPYKPKEPILFESFDKQFFLLQQKIKYTSFVKNFTLKKNKNANYFLANIYSFRHFLANRIDNNLSIPHNSILKALILGLKSDIPVHIKQEFTETGTIHVLAVSGLHVGIIYLILSFLLKRLKLKHVIVIIFLWGFAALTGFSHSIVRAVIFLTITEFGKMIHKDSKLSHTLAFTSIILLCINPYSLFNIGFQLSFTAVIGIILFMPFFEPLYAHKHPILKYIYDTVAVSISVKLSLTPILLYHFHSYTPGSMIGNIFVMPYTFLILIGSIPFLTLPSYLAIIMDNIIYSLLFYLELISKWVNLFITGISFTAYQCIISYIIVIFIYKLFQKVTFHKLIGLSIFVCLLSIFTIHDIHTKNQTTELYYLNSSRYRYLICNEKGTVSYIALQEDASFEKYIYNSIVSQKSIKNSKKHPYKTLNNNKVLMKFAKKNYLLDPDKRSIKLPDDSH